MSEFTIMLGTIAPYYNLGLVVIALWLFCRLFALKPKKGVYLHPWKFILAALGIFIAEEVLTIFRAQGIINIPVHINGFFELTIISLFIYTLLSQKHYIKKLKIS